MADEKSDTIANVVQAASCSCEHDDEPEETSDDRFALKDSHHSVGGGRFDIFLERRSVFVEQSFLPGHFAWMRVLMSEVRSEVNFVPSPDPTPFVALSCVPALTQNSAHARCALSVLL